MPPPAPGLDHVAIATRLISPRKDIAHMHPFGVPLSRTVPTLRMDSRARGPRFASLLGALVLTSIASAQALAVDITTASLPGGTAGVAYSEALGAANGTPPYAWTLAEGSVPIGMALDGGGTISGTSNVAGTSFFVVRVTDAVGDTASRPLSIAIAPATAATITFQVQPTDVNAGVNITPAVQVRVSDALGNGVPTELVSLSLVGTGTLTGGGATATDANGIATFNALSVDVTGSKQLSAASGVLTPVTSAAFTVNAAAAATITFQVQPTDVAAGANIAPAVQVRVADAFGNGVPTELVSLSLVGTGTLTGGGATATDANGIATFAGLSIDVTGSKQLSAASGALTPVTSAAFTVNAAAAATITFQVQPTDVNAGANITPAVQVRVADALGNGVPTELVSLSLVGTGTLTGGGATATDANGIATFAGLSIDVTGSKQLSAASGALTPVTSAAFTVNAGAPAVLTIEVQPSDVTASATMTPAVQVKVTDSLGNGVPTELVSLSLLGTGTLTGGDGIPTDANGIATFADLTINLAGSKQLTAASGALTPVTSISFTVSPDAPSTITFEVQPSDVLIGAAITPAVQVKVADAFGNGVPTELVSLSLIGAGTLTGGDAISTDANGIATFSALSIDVAGGKQLTAASGALTPATSVLFNVNCPTITLSPATLPNGATGVAYSQAIGASGGQAPYTFTITLGSLPAGLSLDPGGLLSGTPTGDGQSDFTVRATDATGCFGELAYSLVICGTVGVQPAMLPDAQQGVSYSRSLTATGGVAPYTFEITAGALPAGLSLSPAGLVSGTPTATGVFNFTVTATSVAGCVGSTPVSLTVPGVPAAVTNLSAVRLTSGNDGDGTGLMTVTFTASAFTATAEVYRAPFGGYPRYDEAGGVIPATPSYPPGAPWVLTGVTASGQTDDPPTRDAWCYVVFLKNSVGQASTVSNKTAPKPNYALGDVSDGVTPGAGDNLVNDLDISLLGAHYGISNGAILSAGVSYLDVGPTVDFFVTSRPFTDQRIDFEDLIVFATNYGSVSGPAAILAGADAASRNATSPERVALRAPSLVEQGDLFEASLEVSGAGRMQGLSAELAWDPAVAEIVETRSEGWLESQRAVVWSPRPGAVDAALLGARETGISGSGTLARATFRARRTGDPGLRLADVAARDAANRPLGGSAFQHATQAAAPARTLLLAPWPNPAAGPATLSFALARGGETELAVFSVDGRRIRTLARGAFEPGSYRFTWHGDDDDHRRVAPGVYYVRLVAEGRRHSKTIVRIH